MSMSVLDVYLSSADDRSEPPSTTKRKEENNAVVEKIPPKIQAEPVPSSDFTEDAGTLVSNVEPRKSTSPGAPSTTTDVSLLSLGPFVFAPRVVTKTLSLHGGLMFRETIKVPLPLLRIQKVTARLIGIGGHRCKEWELATGTNVVVKGTNPFNKDDFCRCFAEGHLRVELQALVAEKVDKCSEMVRDYLTELWNDACTNHAVASNGGDHVIGIQRGELGGDRTKTHAVPVVNTVTIAQNSTLGETKLGAGNPKSVARRLGELADVLAAMSSVALSDKTDVAGLVSALKEEPGFPALRHNLEGYVLRAGAFVSSSELLVRSCMKLKLAANPPPLNSDPPPDSNLVELLAKAAKRRANLGAAAELLGAKNPEKTVKSQTKAKTPEDTDADEDELDEERLSVLHGILERVRTDGLESFKAFVGRAFGVDVRGEDDVDRSLGSRDHLRHLSDVDQEEPILAKKAGK